ncbi:hypothetical protein ICM05_04370 [Leucobacter sp. cx-42]|uniref:hypothetical protein n=1 Tax=unclassified Leucobacter TaxID=2621730 RepID=UPI00165E780B|nr:MULTISPECIES: hypothetical protein [unclassified Leucobacter]MBC9953881.1 hypothetical protein [Leucobacter sp. cx-42]
MRRSYLLILPLAVIALTGCTADPTQHDDATVPLSGITEDSDYLVSPNGRLESFPADKSSYLNVRIERTAKLNGRNKSPKLKVMVQAGNEQTTCESFRQYIWSGDVGSSNEYTLECDTYIPKPHELDIISGTVAPEL